MALASQTESNHGAGIYRGRNAPPGAVYDAVNALIDDEGHLFKRGGSAYHSTSNAGVTLGGVSNMGLVGPDTDRTLMWGGTKLYVLNASLGPLELYDDTTATIPYGRPVGVGGVMVFPISPGAAAGPVPAHNRILTYGGSLLPTGGDIGVSTITATINSVTVTKAGGATWVGAVDPGMFVLISGNNFAIVRSVESANSLTLVSPWAGSTISTASYTIQPTIVSSLVVGSSPYSPAPPLTSRIFLGSSGTRLLVAAKNRVYLAGRGFPFPFDKDLYHELPAGADAVGVEGMGDTAFIFTTKGVHAITNVSLDLVDDFANIQQGVERISGELILWGEHGLTPWAGGILVPGLDDIHAMGPDGSSEAITGTPENERVRRLYRSYTKTAGYQPGPATVHRGHLFLPIVNGTTVIDTLVCRMDRGQAWTRWSGHAAGPGYTVKPGSSAAAPKLLGVSAQRVTDLTGCFDPVAGNSADADATIPSLTVITRDYPLSSGGAHGFCQRVRVRAEVTDDANGGTAAAAATVEYSSDQDGGTFTALTERGEQDGGTGWATTTGAKYWFAIVGKRRERIRFRLVFSGGTASTILRSIELLLRPTGKT